MLLCLPIDGPRTLAYTYYSVNITHIMWYIRLGMVDPVYDRPVRVIHQVYDMNRYIIDPVYDRSSVW